MKRATRFIVVLLAVGSLAAYVAAQERGRGRRGYGGYRQQQYDYSDRNGVPNWEVDDEFKNDVFTFIRVRYSSYGGRYRSGGDWATDYPDSELNFSFRLQQLTSLKVNPQPLVLDLTDERLFDYPFIYIIEPGRLSFSDEEVAALRRYLLNGGFLMVDDFWGDEEYQNFYDEFKRVFPEPAQEPQELDLTHEVFRSVYPLKEKPQVPSIHAAVRGDPTANRERPWDESTREAHYKGVFDDKGRMMAIICHNTDLGDGWEREGEDEWYFREFSEKRSYPMGINIVFYAMTH